MRILRTRDGRQMGNAIIVREHTPAMQAIRDYLEKSGQKMWLIETDYGNFVRLTDNEIKELFHDEDPDAMPSDETTHERWTAERSRLRNKTYVEQSDDISDPPQPG